MHTEGHCRMGQMHFLTPHPDALPDEALSHAYFAGLDLIPTPCRLWRGDRCLLHLERPEDGSGNFYAPYYVRNCGRFMLSTATVVERSRPYLLPLELARGTLNRLRTRAEAWRAAGLDLPSELTDRIRAAARSFIAAATSQDDEAGAMALAEQSLELSLDAISVLGREYAQQVFTRRQQDNAVLPTLVAGNLGSWPIPANTEPMFKAAFNAAAVPICWKQLQPAPGKWNWTTTDRMIQWCCRHGLRILAGPLVSLREDDLPDWLTGEQAAYPRLQTHLRQLIQSVLQRYRGQVHLWHAAAGMNVPPRVPLNGEHRLRLTVTAVELARSLDTRTPVFVSVAQPWGEYMGHRRAELAPLSFAEMLVRADIGVAGIGLELNLGLWPGGSYPRDLLEISDFIDIWGLLGLPLIALMAIPSTPAETPRTGLTTTTGAGRSADNQKAPQGQKTIVDQLIPLLLAKQSVYGLVWNHVFDSQPHRFQAAGLFAANDLPKPSLRTLIDLRREHLQ